MFLRLNWKSKGKTLKALNSANIIATITNEYVHSNLVITRNDSFIQASVGICNVRKLHTRTPEKMSGVWMRCL